MPAIPENAADQVKEIMITLNIARHAPIYFSNNVLEPVRNRFHADGMYNSFSLGIRSTFEGVSSLDTLLAQVSK